MNRGQAKYAEGKWVFGTFLSAKRNRRLDRNWSLPESVMKGAKKRPFGGLKGASVVSSLLLHWPYRSPPFYLLLAGFFKVAAALQG